jgi:hypothetical protein
MKPAPTCTGNISNQKYEASKHVREHFQRVTTANPSYETSRWKNEQLDKYHFQKQKGRFLIKEQKINEENLLIDDRLRNIYTEKRQERTQEFAPGLRVGVGTNFVNSIHHKFSYVFDRRHVYRLLSECDARFLARIKEKGSRESQ